VRLHDKKLPVDGVEAGSHEEALMFDLDLHYDDERDDRELMLKPWHPPAAWLPATTETTEAERDSWMQDMTKAAVGCSSGHPMLAGAQAFADHECDLCKGSPTVFQCTACDFDLCASCAAKGAPATKPHDLDSPVEAPVIVKYGWIRIAPQKDALNQSWRREWFVLRNDGTLCSYKDESESAKVLTLVLKDCKVATTVKREDAPHSFLLESMTGGELLRKRGKKTTRKVTASYTLDVDPASWQEAKGWMDLIRKPPPATLKTTRIWSGRTSTKWLTQAETASGKKDYESAMKLYSKARAYVPSDVEIVRALRQMTVGLKEKRAATAKFEAERAAKQAVKDGADAKRKAGNREVKAKNYEAAIALFREAISMDPNNVFVNKEIEKSIAKAEGSIKLRTRCLLTLKPRRC
jgi:hypothetical protein